MLDGGDKLKGEIARTKSDKPLPHTTCGTMNGEFYDVHFTDPSIAVRLTRSSRSG